MQHLINYLEVWIKIQLEEKPLQEPKMNHEMQHSSVEPNMEDKEQDNIYSLNK